MVVFEEKQFFNRWWLLMFIFAVILIVVGSSFYATTDAEEEEALIASIISMAIAIPIVLGLLYIRLETRIDESGVSTAFRPFGFTQKDFPWEEIKEIYLRKYNPVAEYGGWGLRFAGGKRAYNVFGNCGIQIITKDEKDFLIGTQRPKEAEKALRTFRKHA